MKVKPFIRFFGILFILSLLFAEKPAGKRQPLYKTTITDQGYFDGNRIRCDLENNGMFVSHRISGHSGLEWPKGNHTYAVFASGVWLGGKINGDIRVAAAEYSSEFVPGPYGSDKENPIHKLYKVNKSELHDPLANDDFQNWPADLGAPWVDVDGNGTYDPLPTGLDHPDFIGDQVIWFVANDGDTAEHKIFKSLPLGVEIQVTIYGFNRKNVFGDIMYVKELIINKGREKIEDMYIGLWSDPDLGNAGDDFVACDTTLGLGICYNDGVDGDYASYPGGTPAVGYDFFQGPMVPSLGDTALMYGKKHADFKNLKMSSFQKYIGTSDPYWSDPEYAEEAYNLMQGLRKTGQKGINSETGKTTKFDYPDDPTFNTGRGDGIWADRDDHASGDRRFLMNAGPFTMAAGDSQEVVFGIILAANGGPLESYKYLKKVDWFAQTGYDKSINSVIIQTPKAIITPYPEELILEWDDMSEKFNEKDWTNPYSSPVSFDSIYVTDIVDSIVVTLDSVITEDGDLIVTTVVDTFYNYVQVLDRIDTLFQNQPSNYRFEGYNVYQLENPGGTGKKKKIATYDLINGVKKIFDGDYNLYAEEVLLTLVQNGSDSGIKRELSVSEDALNMNSPLKLNREYYFAVTAYAYNPHGYPKTLESNLEVLAVRPQITDYINTNDSTNFYNSFFRADHTKGISGGDVKIRIINPLKLSGDDYKVTFIRYSDENSDQNLLSWQLTNTTMDTLVVENSFVVGGIELLTGENLGALGSPTTTEGFQVLTTDNEPGISWIGITHNASGPLDPIELGAPYWSDWVDYLPNQDYTYSGQQSESDAIWYIGISEASGAGTYASWIANGFAYSGGLGSADQGIGSVVPDDIEIRFTGSAGLGKGIDQWETGDVWDIPFEVWNIGDPTDATDDFQCIVWILDDDASGDYGLLMPGDDYSISGGDNDPYTDRIYTYEPLDRTPGSVGHDAYIAAYEGGAALGAWYAISGEGTAMGVTPLFHRTVFWMHNGGETVDATDRSGYVTEVPETGTIWHVATTKPLTNEDVFTFTTAPYVVYEKVDYSIGNIKVWPNPYFATNPEERNPFDRQMHFTHLPETGECKIRIFDLTGNLVKIINHNNTGSQYAVWDLKNNVDEYVASGMYIAHIEYGDDETILKLAVIQRE